MAGVLRLVVVVLVVVLAISAYLILMPLLYPPIKHVVGSPIKVDGWVIMVRGVVEAKYLKLKSCCSLMFYRAEEGFKFILVDLEVTNVDGEFGKPLKVHGFRLKTDRGAYSRVRSIELKPLPVEMLSGEVLEEFVEFSEFPDVCMIAPGKSIRGDVIFVVPAGERPRVLRFYVADVGAIEVGLEGDYSSSLINFTLLEISRLPGRSTKLLHFNRIAESLVAITSRDFERMESTIFAVLAVPSMPRSIMILLVRAATSPLLLIWLS